MPHIHEETDVDLIAVVARDAAAIVHISTAPAVILVRSRYQSTARAILTVASAQPSLALSGGSGVMSLLPVNAVTVTRVSSTPAVFLISPDTAYRPYAGRAGLDLSMDL